LGAGWLASGSTTSTVGAARMPQRATGLELRLRSCLAMRHAASNGLSFRVEIPHGDPQLRRTSVRRLQGNQRNALEAMSLRLGSMTIGTSVPGCRRAPTKKTCFERSAKIVEVSASIFSEREQAFRGEAHRFSRPRSRNRRVESNGDPNGCYSLVTPESKRGLGL
jgi:hypothetical protein